MVPFRMNLFVWLEMLKKKNVSALYIHFTLSILIYIVSNSTEGQISTIRRKKKKIRGMSHPSLFLKQTLK